MPRFGNKGALPFRTADSITGVGQLTASSMLTTVTSNATANQWGSWTQLLASTSKKVFGFLVCVGIATLEPVRVQFGVGAAASEVPAADVTFQRDTSGYAQKATYRGIHFREIPSGSRIAARAMTNPGNKPVYVGLWLFEVDE